MITKFQRGDYVRVDNFHVGDTHKSVVGIYDSEDIGLDIYWLNLRPSYDSLGRIVLTGIKQKNCYKITKKDWFKFKLQGKGIGLYGA